MIQASIGEFGDFTDIYEEGIPEDEPTIFNQTFGIYYHLSFVMINMLIIINVVIAIMTDTYATMMEQREGLYNAKIIENMS